MAAEQGSKKVLAEHDEPVEEEQEPKQASKTRKTTCKGSGKQATEDAEANAEAEQESQPSPGPARAQRAGRRAAKSVAATPAQRKKHAASAPRTTRRMAAAERCAALPFEIAVLLWDARSSSQAQEALISLFP